MHRDDRVDQFLELAQPDMHGRIGDLAEAFFGRIGRELRPRRDILREQFTVIREFVQNFAGAVVAMVPAGALYRLGIGNDFLLELLQDQSRRGLAEPRSEEHTSELQSLMRISYAVFCLKKKK